MKKSAILGLLTIAIAIAVIISLYSKTSSYSTFSEAKKSDDMLRVVGHLDKQKELHYDAAKNVNYFSFYVKDNKGEECKVIFGAPEPQDFEKSEQIVLTGQMVGSEFHAKEILMKCPSKYTPDKLNSTGAKSTSAAF